MRRSQAGFSITELLGAMAIIVATALASITITLQVIKTSRKSKIVAMGISLESALLEAVAGQSLNTYTTSVTAYLRAGTGLQTIVLNSNFGTTETDPSHAIPFYTLNPDGVSPAALCVDEAGRFPIGGCAGNWVLKLQAAYRLTSIAAGNLPQYAIAYLISGNSTGPSFRSFGQGDLSSGTFQTTDFFFPIPQNVYSGLQQDYTYADPDAEFGKCDIDENRVISLFSLDLQSGAIGCVIKGDECPPGTLATDLQMANFAMTAPHVLLNMTCTPIKKCGCKHLGANNWEVTSFIPSSLVDLPGTHCGTCEYAFKKVILDLPFHNPEALTVFTDGICPSQKYDVIGVNCSATAEWVQDDHTVTTAAYCDPPDAAGNITCYPDIVACDSWSPGGAPNQTPVVTQGGGRVTCTASSIVAAQCGHWQYWVKPISLASCKLTGKLGDIIDDARVR